MNMFLLTIFLVKVASSQFVGTWLRDWQSPNFSCAASSFTITGDDLWGYRIKYTYSQQVLSSVFCSEINIIEDFESYLMQDLATGVWTDSHNQSFIYYDSNDTILFQSSEQETVKNLYDKTGSFISLELAAGLIMGNWINPKLIDSSSEGCANEIMTNLSIYLQSENNNLDNILGIYFTNTLSRNFMAIRVPMQINQLRWRDNGGEFTFSYAGLLNAQNQNTLFLQHFNRQNRWDSSSCTYSYERDIHFISGTWLADWQSLYSSDAFSPSQIQIINVDNTYMKIAYSYPNQTLESLFYPYQNHFRDNASTIMHYQPKNSFISISQRVMYTPTGSLHSPEPFIGNWSNLQMQNQTDSCCVPDYIMITNSSKLSQLSALYYFNPDMLQSPSCLDFELDIENGELTSTLFIGFPSPLQLIWMDDNQYSIKFTNSSTEEEIFVTWQDTCPFVMTKQLTLIPTSPTNPDLNSSIPNFSLLILNSLAPFMLLFMFL